MKHVQLWSQLFFTLCLLSSATSVYTTPAIAKSNVDDYFSMSFDALMDIEVSIATGTSQPLRTAPAVASVITAEEIKASGATSMHEVLERVPGLHISNVSIRFDTNYIFRGIHSDFNSQVLFLINGIPATHLLIGARSEFFAVPLPSISRIEVIRGPGSAIYGADAFAGVINIITKKGDEIDGTYAGMRVGSFDSQAAWLQHGGRWGDYEVAFSFDASRTDGDDKRVITADRVGNSGILDTRIKHADTRLEIGKGRWYSRLWNHRIIDAGEGPGIASALDPTGHVEVDDYYLDVSYDHPDLADEWDVKAVLSYLNATTRMRHRLFPAGSTFAPSPPYADGMIGGPENFEQHSRLDLSSVYHGFKGHTLRLATGASKARYQAEATQNFFPVTGTMTGVGGTIGVMSSTTGTVDIYMPNKSRTLSYISLQDEWGISPDWALTTGLRFDRYTDIGNTTNPRLALVWQTNEKLTSKLLYGRAFRAPSFGELFSINNPVRLGNPSLTPETIDTVELAFNYRLSRDTTLNLNLYRYQIDDLIDIVFDPAPATTATTQNSGKLNGKGFELELFWRLKEGLNLRSNYAMQSTKDKSTNSEMGYAPQNHLYTQLDWRFLPEWHLNSQVNHVTNRRRASGDTRSEVADYTTMDLAVRRNNIAKHWELALSIHNLFDEDAHEPSPTGSFLPNDIPLEGRTVYGEIRYRM